ncbi:hypothetical protein [Brevundimonas sp. TWP2-3-4b2]|uniref:hypothetical protein n=1 Tax=Brevundimonas sp. TWP2-3-4b2 TaxID=2804595 RepID=UPI003CE6A57E
MVEFTVVVLGVLVALGLENLVQEARFRTDARDLERAFVDDVSRAAFLSLERQAVTPCLIQRLRVLSERVDAATGDLEPVEASSSGFGFATPQIYRSPTRLWVTSSFDRALGSEAFKRIPADRAVEYASLFAQIRKQQELNDAEFLAAMGLAPLAYSQLNMDAEVRADALQQISNLDRHQALIATASEQIVENALSLQLIGKDVRQFLDDDEGFPEYRSEMIAAYGDCLDFTAMERLLTPDAS